MKYNGASYMLNSQSLQYNKHLNGRMYHLYKIYIKHDCDISEYEYDIMKERTQVFYLKNPKAQGFRDDE